MNVLYIPSGPKNLASLFPDIDFNQVEEYFVEIEGVGQTNNYKVVTPCEDNVRIHFINYLGSVDAINTCLQTNEHQTTSDSVEVPLVAPLYTPRHSGSRFNIKSNDVITVVTNEFSEDEMDFIAELQDSPGAWVEWTGMQNQGSSYQAIKILDAKFQKIQADYRFDYQVTIQFTYSADRIILRSNVSQPIFTADGGVQPPGVS